MRIRWSRCVVGLLLVVFFACPVFAANVTESPAPETIESLAIPPDATPEQLREIMASLSDEQVRAVLIQELKKEAAVMATPKKETGLAGLVQRLRKASSFLRDRFEYLFSGAATAPRELPEKVKNILGGDDSLTVGKLLLALLVLTGLWLVAMFIFRKKTVKIRESFEITPPDALWYTCMGRLFMRALLDAFGIILILAVVFAGYLILFSEGAASKPVVIAWLAAIVFLEMVKLVARFILAPKAPALRYLPLTDQTAQYLYKWILWIGRIIALGLLLTTLLRLEGGSEALLLLVSTLCGLTVVFVLVLLILWNSRPVALALQARNTPGSLGYQFAGFWHVAAIAYVLGFWVFWVLGLMIFGTKAMVPGIMTLLAVPLYLIFDWATQRLVSFAADIAGPAIPDQAEDGVEDAADAGEPVGLIEKHATRFQTFLSKGFRFILLAGFVFGLLHVWGIDFDFGRATVRASFNTLITLVLAYIVWVFISRTIERKLTAKAADQGAGGGHEGGGPGGDRFATLLQLLKKFIFGALLVITVLIILSSLGVDIGPLIAGASVFGIAIGFGAQTLVKDIISGIFFLTDDAFRVGDYIETSGAMGTVEEISVRSLKLRHHLGFLYTIPFGSMKLVKNNTRDWAVMKLQYLVPFDTDIQQVKKIIKKINKEVRAVPELNKVMLGDIKSQGVKAMEEYGMRMRVKFMTKPGGQFTLRKLVLAKMRKHFAEAGIEFARPRVSVQIPDGVELSDEERAQVAAAASQTIDAKEKAKAAAKKKKK
ncbi:mechanosensitive ion channel [Pseudodesulfovibrio sp. JC047]|uniref:mechanosensitive ion channel family protein n=1 Tax=Pseudodesulfovibrio sp. JC047 TaxID=2683199 RepID=UPI0013D458C2|nr:mechanosensitive ion channel family protein [Pseudodesulfovibrio sp. JC047]NDV19422.1 mechanosensitive ion channel [Pseudodesulfovibrio sp. JC047]